MTERKSGAQMAEELTNFLNSALPDQENDFVEALMREHRTLQADTFKLFMNCIYAWSKAHNEGRYDDRNEYSCMMSNIIVKKVFEE